VVLTAAQISPVDRTDGAIVVDLAAPVLLLVVVPALAAALPGQFVIWPWWNWSRLFFSVPDLAFAWFVLAAAWLAAGLIKLARLRRTG